MHTNGATKLDPAKTVIERFTARDKNGNPLKSGVAVIADSLGLSYSSVFRWQSPKSKGGRGHGGNVPWKHHRDLRELANRKRVKLPKTLVSEADHG